MEKRKNSLVLETILLTDLYISGDTLACLKSWCDLGVQNSAGQLAQGGLGPFSRGISVVKSLL